MARILVLGAGLSGLGTAMVLARDGHDVTVLERDPAEPPPPDRPDEAWQDWSRAGVNQFRLPHYMQPLWWALIRAEVAEAGAALIAAGATPMNTLEMLPLARRGPVQAADARFETLSARRPVLEAALTAAAIGLGVDIRRGITVTGLTTSGEATAVPRVTGVRAGGVELAASLVVDCTGRRSAVGAWLAAIGARSPIEERADSGFVYYGRHFRSRDGRLPEALAVNMHSYDSLTILTLPADNGTWSVVLTTASLDRSLRVLRDPRTWQAAVARYPLVAHWTDGEPISGVDVMAGIEDRHRSLFVNGRPIVTGLVLVGDTWAATNPSLGRGASIALRHACLLRQLIRDCDLADHDGFVRQFNQVTEESVEPMYRATRSYDRHRLAEIDGDIAGVPYQTDDKNWLISKALYAGSITDPELTRAFLTISGLLATPNEVFASPGLLDRVLALGMGRPPYPLPGLTRPELLQVVA